MAGNGKNHHAQELPDDAIVLGLRSDGRGYREIADALGLTARQVDAVLGEVAALHAAGHSHREIGRRVGLARTTVQDLLRDNRSPRSTLRKSAALTALAEQGGMQLDMLGWFLDLDRNHTYALVKQLREEKLVRELEKIRAGEKWVMLTRGTDSRILGFGVREFRPSPKQAEHHRAVAQARIMLVGDDLEGWISERVLWHRADVAAAESKSKYREFSTGRNPRGGVTHIHDGRFLATLNGVRGWWALEVELTRKSAKDMDTALRGAVRAAGDAGPEKVVGLLYLCRSAGVKDGVYAALDRLPPDAAAIDIVFDARDFDDAWHDFLIDRAAKRKRRTKIRSTKDAS
ncbi:hypothetical protein ACFYTS_02200 [Nocardia sp. NPDC004151]|uniref:hypothetical protein n=1 Tax=Nocardia sp. NPDC004151 TaxID=3364304 RepID=UPI0036B7584C